jgi:hypothetical protein
MEAYSVKKLNRVRRGLLLVAVNLAVLIGMACGPETIFLRPALDTPAQHVDNGHRLLSRGKIDAADAEFSRAKNLDQGYVPAYVGLALIQGHRGDIRGGLEMLDQARSHAATPAEVNAVNDGYEQLKKIQAAGGD